MQRMLRGKEGIMSLAQGIVHWSPPPAALEAAQKAAQEPDTNSYCADDGLPKFREALKEKLKKENGLDGVEVMVTAGANQAYTNLVCTLLDEQDGSWLIITWSRPFYFNHRMALQMTGGHANVVLAPSTKDRNIGGDEGHAPHCCIAGDHVVNVFSFSAPGELRLCYANLPTAKCIDAAQRLKACFVL
eukprot:Skav204623  [mRNA]  locus=scaffold1712:235083:244373:- [translate_table: standard]